MRSGLCTGAKTLTCGAAWLRPVAPARYNRLISHCLLKTTAGLMAVNSFLWLLDRSCACILPKERFKQLLAHIFEENLVRHSSSIRVHYSRYCHLYYVAWIRDTHLRMRWETVDLVNLAVEWSPSSLECILLRDLQPKKLSVIRDIPVMYCASVTECDPHTLTRPLTSKT